MSRVKKVRCPTCGQNARVTQTQYGRRNDCCGLHSWGRKPLVPQLVHDLRQQFHTWADPLWQSGRMSRGGMYRALARATGLPEADCHGASQEDPAKLTQLIAAAQALTLGPRGTT